MNKYNNSVLNPSEIVEHPWLYETNMNINNINESISVTGKWMLFYDNSNMDIKWSQIKELYRNNELDGVTSMKCSTMYDNPRSSNKNTGVIILYCNDSYNENKIKSIGRNIMEILSYNKSMYYKTDIQTHGGTIATGQNKNHLYKIGPFDLYSFID